MSVKKYQVFISSTFQDLTNERKQILEILLMADCIPAGMEAFVATDEEQFNVIKKVIDLCDYYLLIIGGRYGSINEHTGKSYTEMEYDYAIEKGIPVLVFSIDDTVKLDENKTDNDVIKKGKLAEFKQRAMRNRLASVWRDSSDLGGKVAISIMAAKQQIDRPGWIRGGEEHNDLMKKIINLNNENELLKNELENIKNAVTTEISETLSFYGYEIELNYTEQVYIYTFDTEFKTKVVKTTLDDLFKFISIRLTGRHRKIEFVEALNSFVEGYCIDEQQALVLKNQYTQLGLFSSKKGKDGEEIIELTEKGEKIMNELNLLK